MAHVVKSQVYFGKGQLDTAIAEANAAIAETPIFRTRTPTPDSTRSLSGAQLKRFKRSKLRCG